MLILKKRDVRGFNNLKTVWRDKTLVTGPGCNIYRGIKQEETSEDLK